MRKQDCITAKDPCPFIIFLTVLTVVTLLTVLILFNVLTVLTLLTLLTVLIFIECNDCTDRTSKRLCNAATAAHYELRGISILISESFRSSGIYQVDK